MCSRHLIAPMVPPRTDQTNVSTCETRVVCTCCEALTSRHQTSALGVQIYWLLRTMAQDQRRPGSAVTTLLQAVQQAATAPKLPPPPPQHPRQTVSPGTPSLTLPEGPRLRTLRRHTTSVVIPSAGPCEGLSQWDPGAAPFSSLGGELTAGANLADSADVQRLSQLHDDLGVGEGVSQLVRASLDDLRDGGSGMLSVAAQSATLTGGDAAECFGATVDFFDRLCASSSTLVPAAPARRQSMLRQRLEGINVKLHSPEAAGRVRPAPQPSAARPCCVSQSCIRGGTLRAAPASVSPTA